MLFDKMRVIAKPVTALVSLLIALNPISQSWAGQVKNGEAMGTSSLQVDQDLENQWKEWLKSGKVDFRAGANNSSAVMLDMPANLLSDQIWRVNGSIAQVFARYDSVAAEGVIDIVWLERNLNDTVTFKMDRVGGRSGATDYGSAWGQVFSSKSDGYHCDNRYLVTGKDSRGIESCANPLAHRAFTTDENGRAILTGINFEAFIGLVGLTQAKFKAAEAWVAADNTAYGDAARKVDQWKTTKSCGMFCKRTTQHVTMTQTKVSWYVSTPGISNRPDAIMGGYCVDPSDATDGTCNGAKVVGQTAFVKAANDASLPQGAARAYYYTKSQEGLTGLGFALAIFAVVALTVATGGAAGAAWAANISATVGTMGAGAIAAGGYAVISTVASDGRGIDQVQNGLFGNLSDGQLASGMGSGLGGEMNMAVRNKFIYADPLFSYRGGGQPAWVGGNSGGGNWNAGQNIYMSTFALGDNGGRSCGSAGQLIGACSYPGRMIRPNDFFIQTSAAPMVKAYSEGVEYSRPSFKSMTSDSSLNIQLDAARALSAEKMKQYSDFKNRTFESMGTPIKR